MRAWPVLALVLAGCAEPPPPAALPEHPSVVSLNPCADAILAEIAEPGQVLALSHYSHDSDATSMPLNQAMAYPVTGGTAEEVLALSPDMVVADVFLAPATRRALEQAGIAVETIGIAGSLEDSLAQVGQLGAATGNPARAEALAAGIAASWEQNRWQGPRLTAVLWQEGGIVAGEGSLANAMLEQAGFTSLPAARGMGQGAYLPLEEVLADPPQVLIAAGDERAHGHPALASLPRFDLDPAMLYCGGPTIPRALERLLAMREAAA